MSRADLYFSLIHSRAMFANQWVDRFYHRLDEEVRSRAAPAPGLRPGSLYFATAGEARRELARDLPAVRVLVPLYTREFLHTPPPDFDDHLLRRAESADLPFVHPVLWDAYIPARSVSGLAQAMSLGHSIPEYGDCGMGSICRLNAYTRELKEIVELLADRVVYAAEHPDHIPDWIRNARAPALPSGSEARFLISVARPYGQGADWTPFGAEHGSVIGRAVQAAQRLLLLPEVVDRLSVPTMDNGVRDCAGVLLLDPGSLDDSAGRPAIDHLLDRRPPWISIVVVVGREPGDDGTRVWELVDEAKVRVGQGVQIARDAAEFDQVIGAAIQRARRNFLRRHPNSRP